MQKKTRVLVKVGSNVLTDTQGGLDKDILRQLVLQIAWLRNEGAEVILVSSGAVASGRGIVTLPEKIDLVSRRQILAATGQVKLIGAYASLFEGHQIATAQVLVTKEDFRDREHYLNMKNCLEALLRYEIVPIINENDVISVTELMFTDNDELAGLLSAMLNVNKLIILSNVDGIYNGDPKHPGSEVIRQVAYGTDSYSQFITQDKSQFGRGGMLTKCGIAHKMAGLGIEVRIANGKSSTILSQIWNNEPVGTQFLPKKNASTIKRWVANSEGFVKTQVVVDEGARKVLLHAEKPTSLLPVGVTHTEGEFKKGDIVKIVDQKGNVLGLGKTQFGSDKLAEHQAEKKQKPLIHYDYLFIY